MSMHMRFWYLSHCQATYYKAHGDRLNTAFAARIHNVCL